MIALDIPNLNCTIALRSVAGSNSELLTGSLSCEVNGKLEELVYFRSSLMYLVYETPDVFLGRLNH